MAEEPTRDAPLVEVMVVDRSHERPGLLRALRGAVGLGLMGAGAFGLGATFLGRKWVAWSETPLLLTQCKEPVETAVTRALDRLTLAQGSAFVLGFLLLFFVGFPYLRRQRAAKRP